MAYKVLICYTAFY